MSTDVPAPRTCSMSGERPMPRMLLTSACQEPRLPRGDLRDEFCYRNTAGQGCFSMRQTQSWHPLHLIAQNCACPSTVLENPSVGRFRHEVASRQYSIVGISFTLATVRMVVRMVRTVRDVSPCSAIVLGGYGTALFRSDSSLLRELAPMVDYVCPGEGVRFMRDLLAERFGVAAPVPLVQQLRPIRIGLPFVPWAIAEIPVIVRALGCRNRCPFCATTHQYRGARIELVDTDRLHGLLREVLARRPGTSEVMVFDEDFLADRHEALRLRDMLRTDPLIAGSDISLLVFASVRSVERFTVNELADLRIGTVFIGVESAASAPLDSCTAAKRGSEPLDALCSRLHAAGISTIASLIVGWDGQTAAALETERARFVALNPTLYQVLPLMAMPGTGLWERMARAERIRTEVDLERLQPGQSTVQFTDLTQDDIRRWMTRTHRDLVAEGGPWFFRYAENHLAGWRAGFGERHRRAMLRLLPLVMGPGALLLAYRGPYRVRWVRFVARMTRMLPVQLILGMCAGIIVLPLLLGLQFLVFATLSLFGRTEQPPYSVTRYPGRAP